MHEKRGDVIITLKVFKGSGNFLTIIKHNVRVFAEKIADKNIIDDAGTLTNGDVHVISFFAEPVEIISSINILGFPRRLL
jgi:hypothetical protein